MDGATLHRLAPQLLGRDITRARADELAEELRVLCDAVASRLPLLAYDDEPDDFLKVLEERGHD